MSLASVTLLVLHMRTVTSEATSVAATSEATSVAATSVATAALSLPSIIPPLV
jgi:hypothetical protein